MSGLKLYLLGPPRVELDHSVVDIRRRKALALLAYLAVTGEGQRRDTLATLLWPETSQSGARASLSRDLSVLNNLFANRWLTADRETVALCPDAQLWVDHSEFQQQLAACQSHQHPPDQICSACLESLTEAVTLYRADFLSGFTLSGCPAFDEWQSFQTESLRRELAIALERLVRVHQTQGDVAVAVSYARRWLSLDPLHEPAHRQLMQLYAQTGDRAAAVRQYQECVDLLEAELGVPPADETTALYERIRTEVVKPVESISPVPRHNLPSQPTPFIGRAEELARIAKRLADPTCRLLTLTGPGGIGKTRLALQAASSLIEAPSEGIQFSHGVYFVSLAPLSSPEHLVPAIAEVLNLSFYGDVDPKVQLLNYLREKAMLLVLDNFEHLLSPPEGGAINLVTDILANAPAVKILVTSWEALNLQEEWFYPVEGLAFPTSDEVEDEARLAALEDYSAVQLFVQSARRVRPGFSLTAEQDCVTRICQLVEGMPLGIELAAAWLKVFSCTNIVLEIERSLDFMATRLHNVPTRHRSIRAVFEHSWHLLSEQERGVLRQLSVFRGGFRQGPAQQVAGAALPVLASLIEKSLLRSTPSGRYQMHELLRQFAEKKLREVPREQDETQERHSDYYLTFLQKREEALQGKQQQAALAEIGAEIENVRAAWHWAVERGKTDKIDQALDSLCDFYTIRSRYHEGKQAFEKAAERLQDPVLQPQSEIVLGRVLARYGTFCFWLALDESAEDLLQQSLGLARRLDARREMAFCLDYLGRLVWAQGRIAAAKPLFQESLAISRAIGDLLGMATALHGLGNVIAEQLGNYTEAKALFQESLVVSRRIGHPDRIAHALDKLGAVATYRGEYIEAEQYLQEGLAIFKEIGNRFGIASVLGGLGRLAWCLGGARLAKAKSLLEESVAICREIDDRLLTVVVLGELGRVTNSLGEYQESLQYGREALNMAKETSHLFGVWNLAVLGEAALGLGDFQAARVYFYEALKTAMEAQENMFILEALFHLATLLMKESDLPMAGSFSREEVPSRAGRKEQALELLVLVLHHHASWQVYKDRAARLVAELEAELPPVVVAAAQERGQARDLWETARELLVELGGE